jgi:hypothetical protein
MGLEKREKQIGEHTYSMLLPPPSKAMAICNEAAVLFGPVLGAMSRQTGENGWEMFTLMLQQMEPEKLDRILMRAIEASKLTVNGTPICSQIPFDQHFNDNRSDLYPVCFWVLWESIVDFFPQLAAFTQTASQIIAQASKSPIVG